MIVRCLGVILWTLILMCVKLNSLRYATQLILQQSKVVPWDGITHHLHVSCWIGGTADIGLPEPLLFYSVYSSSYTKGFAVTCHRDCCM